MKNPQDNLRRLLQKMEARYGSDDVHVQQLRAELAAMQAAPPVQAAPVSAVPTPLTPSLNVHFVKTRKTAPVRVGPSPEDTFPPITWPQWHETAWPASATK